jgi:hypothetical protein
MSFLMSTFIIILSPDARNSACGAFLHGPALVVTHSYAYKSQVGVRCGGASGSVDLSSLLYAPSRVICM